jgi:hypothetical protein
MSKNQKKYPPSQKAVEFWGLLCVIIGITLFLGAKYYLENSKWWQSFVELLASGLFTTGLFSILLGLNDLRTYFSERLREIIVEKSYLKTISETERATIKASIDEQLFGSAINEKDSLYRFISDWSDPLMTSHYRTDVSDHYEFRTDEKDPSRWYVVNEMTYNLHWNPAAGPENIPFVPQNLENKVREGSNPTTQWKLTVSIDDENFELKHDDGKPCLACSSTNIHLKKNVDVRHEIVNSDGAIRELMEIKILLNSFLFTKKDFVRVVIRNEDSIDKTDNTLSLRMVLPSRHVRLSCHFCDPEELQLTCLSFGRDNNAHYPFVGRNYASIDVKEWILPGHGAVITWLRTPPATKPH